MGKEDVSYFKKWYETEKDKLSERRKERYQNDPEYRAKCLARAAERRAKFPKPSKAGQPKFKEVNGKQVEVFRIGDVCRAIGVYEKTVRNWEAAGTIPKPIAEGEHRYYTKHQIELMRELGKVCHAYRYDRQNRATVIAAVSAEIRRKWNTAE